MTGTRIKSVVNKADEKNSPDLTQKVHQLRARKKFAEMYARIPLSILCNPDLTGADKMVYATVAVFVWQGSVCRESLSDLANVASLSKRQVMASIKRLCERGLMKRDGSERSVATILLVSPVFGKKQRSGEVEEVISSPSRGRRLASVRIA